MATIVNTPGTNSDSSASNGLVVGLLLLIILAILFWLFGMPYFRGGSANKTPTNNVENNIQNPNPTDQAPAQGGDTNINVPIPEKVDVNVSNGQEGQ